MRPRELNRTAALTTGTVLLLSCGGGPAISPDPSGLEAQPPAPPVIAPASPTDPVAPAAPALLPGFADLHNHQFAEYAYQGAWYHGTTLGPVGGDETWEGMRACDGNRADGPQDHAMTYMNVLCRAAGWATDDMCQHTDRRYGYATGREAERSYSGWPHATSWAHQQTWWGHLKKAHEDGLNLTVVHAVNFKPLCEIMEPSNYRYFYDCEDLGAVDLQLEAAKAFADLHADWMEIAYSPADARRIIGAGKLAMVLGIEVTGIFPTGGMDFAPMVYDAEGNIIDRGGVFTQLHHYYDLGVRTIQLGHELDSRFAGVAVYSPIFELLDAIRDVQGAHPGALDHLELPGGDDPDYGFRLNEEGYNELGLTEEGRALTREMMKLGMLVDIAHLSYRSVDDVYALSTENGYYPLFHSHSKLASIMVLPGEEPLEKYTTDEIARRVRATGGMLGLRSFAARVNTFGGSGVENNCDGSSRSFAQAYAYADQVLEVNVGLGVDFNGFADQTGPRFGERACADAPDEATRAVQQAAQIDAGTGTAFDTVGLGHMGLVGGGLVNDLRRLGADTSRLERSAEAFVRMWERALDPARNGPAE